MLPFVVISTYDMAMFSTYDILWLQLRKWLWWSKSIYGYYKLVEENLVTRLNQKQHVIYFFNAEAEYHATMHASYEILLLNAPNTSRLIVVLFTIKYLTG